MPRQKKLRKADFVKFQGVEVDIMYDPNKLIFQAEFMDCSYSDERAATLKHTIYTKIKESLQLTWIPVIEVHLEQPFTCQDQREPFIGFTLKRFHVAVRPDGQFLQVQWEHVTSQETTGYMMYTHRMHLQLDEGEGLTFPYEEKRFGHDGRTIFLYYKEELWKGLLQLQDTILVVKERLTELIGTEDGHAQLEAVGADLLKMLPGGQEDAETADKVIYNTHSHIDPTLLTEEEGEEDYETEIVHQRKEGAPDGTSVL